MRWIIGIVSIILVLFAALYALLFTSAGNNLLRPVIENKINETLPLQSRLETFMLDTDSFEVSLLLTPENRVNAAGNFSLFTQAFRIVYDVRFDQLEALKPVTETVFYGRLHTKGEAEGDLENVKITGSSNVADSETDYTLTLADMKPQSVKASVRHAAVETLLAMVGKAAYAEARLDLDADMRDLNPEQPEGDVAVKLADGKVDPALMLRDFNVTLPKTTFTMNGTAGLRGKSIRYNADFDSNLANVTSAGLVSPDPLQADLAYNVDFRELALLAPLTNAPLRGPLRLKGTVKGDEALLNIDGTSDIAASDTAYHVTMKQKKPSEVIASVKNAKLEKLLYMLGKPDYASAKLNADVKLHDLDPKNLQGNAVIALKDGKMNAGVMQRDFNVTIPKQTRFTLDAKAQLKGKSVDYQTDLNSNLAKIGSGGTVIPETMAMDLDYALDIAKLEALKPVTNAPLRGPLRINGTVKGDKSLLHVKGTSDLAKSKTRFHAQLKDFAPKSVEADIRSLDLSRLLYMVEQPAYLKQGTLDVAVRIPNAADGALDGTVTTAIKAAEISGKVVAEQFDFKHQPKITFETKSRSVLKGDRIDSSLDVNSNAADLKIASAVYDLGKQKLTSDYRVDIPDLDAFYFATEQHMQGGIAMHGKVEKAEKLLFTMQSDTLGGTIDAKLNDKDFRADLKGLNTLKLLHMLIYPEVFDAAMDGTLKYNLESKKGTLDSSLTEGKFTQNEMFDLLRQYSTVDLYRERFKGTLQSRIDDKIIDSDLDLRSNVSSIQTKNAHLDSEKKQIDADVHVNANNNPFNLKIRGDLDKPSITIDAKKLIEREAGKQLNRLLNDYLNK